MVKLLELLALFIFSVYFPEPAPASTPELVVTTPMPTSEMEDAPSLNPCDDANGEEWSDARRKNTRRRVQYVCKAVRASLLICTMLDVMVVRESSGRAGVGHTKGENENGLGPLGLSLRWQHDKWPGTDENPMFCYPEVSALVTLAIFHRAMSRYHAENAVDLQSIFGGRWDCEGEGKERHCTPTSGQRSQDAICGRLAARDHDCFQVISKKHLGKKIPFGQRREFAMTMIEEGPKL